MVVIRKSGGGRYEVFAAGRHWEAFDGTLGALLVAQALAGQIAAETGAAAVIQTPWGDKRVEPASSAQVEVRADALQVAVDP